MSDPIQSPLQSNATLQNHAVKPPGILPKNAQTWLIAGISLVMVAVIALSGNPTPRPTSPSTPSAKAPAVIDPNAARIAEYRNRIEEQARRLAAEQAALNEAKQSFAGNIQTAGPPMGTSYSPAAPPPPAQPPFDERAAQRNQLDAERERREYQSLFASNVALSYREDARLSAGEQPRTNAAANPLPFYTVPPTAPSPVTGPTLGVAHGSGPSNQLPVRSPAAETPSTTEPEAEARAVRRVWPELNQAEGKQYRLFEGTIIEAVLTNRLTGSLSGPVNCMVTTDVYSHDRQRLLIPKGSRVLGEVNQVNSFGQQRLAVAFHRLIMPDGFSVNLDQFRGLNQIGETGLRDKVNRHYLQTFGVSIAIGAIAGLAQANTRYGFEVSAGDAYRQGFGTSLAQSSMRILDRYLNILPTFTVREGHRMKIYLADDLLLPAYDRHKVPSDL